MQLIRKCRNLISRRTDSISLFCLSVGGLTPFLQSSYQLCAGHGGCVPILRRVPAIGMVTEKGTVTSNNLFSTTVTQADCHQICRKLDQKSNHCARVVSLSQATL